MKSTRNQDLIAAVLVAALALVTTVTQAADVLPSWNDGKAKQSIMAFVPRTTPGGKDFMPAAERIAVFDNDGTLWSEQPMYFPLGSFRGWAKLIG